MSLYVVPKSISLLKNKILLGQKEEFKNKLSNLNIGTFSVPSNGDYLSFRELTLSYSLPRQWLSKVSIESLTVSVTGQNLGYLCAAPYVFSPEVASNWGGYPLPRMLVLGLNLTF